MRILLDTHLLVGAPRVDLLTDADTVMTSALSYAELLEGEFSPDPAVRARAHEDYYLMRELLGPGLPFDDAAAAAYRRICQAVTTRERQVGRARRTDLMIAAIALARDCVLATRNVDDYAGLHGLVDVIAL